MLKANGKRQVSSFDLKLLQSEIYVQFQTYVPTDLRAPQRLFSLFLRLHP